MGALSPTHWLIIIVVVVLLFGGKRLPDAARSLGRSARILKAEIGEMGNPDKPAEPAPRASALPSATERPTANPERPGAQAAVQEPGTSVPQATGDAAKDATAR